MFKVIKKQGKIVEAYRLGEESEPVRRLIQEGKIVEKDQGIFEVFSQEAVNTSGEIAYPGDYIKVDSSGAPYPVKSDFFLKNHRRLDGIRYEQIPVPLDAWTSDQEMCEEINYLIKEKGLMIDETSEDKYFTAPLWGTMLSAARDAVIVFYEIKRDNKGLIRDIDFNFVQHEEFEKTYHVCMDKKVRLPEEVTGAVVLTTGPENVLLVFEKNSWDQMITRLEEMKDVSVQWRQRFLRHFLMSGALMEIDSSGKITIPDRLWQYLTGDEELQKVTVLQAKDFADSVSDNVRYLKEMMLNYASYVIIGENK